MYFLANHLLYKASPIYILTNLIFELVMYSHGVKFRDTEGCTTENSVPTPNFHLTCLLPCSQLLADTSVSF